MGLKYGRGGFAFPVPLVTLAGYLAPFFTLGRKSQVRYGFHFVLGGDGGVPEPDEVVPGCGEEMRASVIGGNGR